MALRQQYPRRVREYAPGHAKQLEEPTPWLEDEPTGNLSSDGVALLRRLRAGSIHFRCFAFRAAFSHYCLDSGTLRALLGRRYISASGEDVFLEPGVLALRAHRVTHQSGVTCGCHAGTVVIDESSALDATAGVSARHSCNSAGLIFATHALEEAEANNASAEEVELLARTTYGLAYVAPSIHRDLAGAAGWDTTREEKWGEEEAPGAVLAQADAYPRRGAEEGFAVEHLSVLRAHGAGGEEPGPFLDRMHTWRLALAYGLVVETGHLSQGAGSVEAAEMRLQYKLQVMAAVKACALAHCELLLVGCGDGILGGAEAAVSPRARAEVWAEVLLGEGRMAGLAKNFRAVAFCLGGRADTESRRRTRDVLKAAFAL